MMQELILWLNERTKEYDAGKPTVSDAEWDSKYFQLVELEREFGYSYPNSPTQTIIYETVNELKKIEHEHPMLSLPKTKSEEEALSEFKDPCIMLKMDGLTISLTYEKGELVRAETRGNGKVGEDVIHNARVIPSIPNKIQTDIDKMVIDGEIICNYRNFQPFSTEYKNPRNFAAGSVRLLDAKECSKRQLEFIAWDVIEGFEDKDSIEDKLEAIKKLGFIIVPYMKEEYKKYSENTVEAMKALANELAYPIDGLVYKEKSAKKRMKLGATSHHLGGAIALKFADEEFDTFLKDIEYTPGRLGFLTPVAIFEAVDDGESTIERASLHNLSILASLLGEQPYVGQEIKVVKSNQIIPQVVSGNKEIPEGVKKIELPAVCPVCRSETRVITTDSGVKNLYCTNEACSGKIINSLNHFAGKKGLDIRGLSSATLMKLIEWGWINSISDIFKLEDKKVEWSNKTGFGDKSVQKVLAAINDSKKVSMDKFITALGIPLIGSAVSIEICKKFETYSDFRKAIKERFNFSKWEGFGIEMTAALLSYDYSEADKIYENYLTVFNEYFTSSSTSGLNITVVITGKLNGFSNRDELKKKIELAGGKVAGSISKKTDYLINNDIESTSSKNKKAKELGIPIITEEEFCSKFL